MPEGPEIKAAPADYLEATKAWIRKNFPGVAKMADDIEKVSGIVGAGDISSASTAGAPFIIRKGETEAEAFANFLRNAWPNIKYYKSKSGQMLPSIGPDAMQNTNTLRKVIDKSPEMEKILDNYMRAVDEWIGGATGAMRESKNPFYQKMAENLQTLYDASKNKSTSTLYRGTTGAELGTQFYDRLSNQDIINSTFENPFASYTTNKNKALSWVGNSSNDVILRLEPGAQTLPLAGLSNMGSELEHLVGGRFKINNVLQRNIYGRPIISVQQVQPFLSPNDKEIAQNVEPIIQGSRNAIKKMIAKTTTKLPAADNPIVDAIYPNTVPLTEMHKNAINAVNKVLKTNFSTEHPMLDTTLGTIMKYAQLNGLLGGK